MVLDAVYKNNSLIQANYFFAKGLIYYLIAGRKYGV
jgi:hypothetical protein